MTTEQLNKLRRAMKRSRLFVAFNDERGMARQVLRICKHGTIRIATQGISYGVIHADTVYYRQFFKATRP